MYSLFHKVPSGAERIWDFYSSYVEEYFLTEKRPEPETKCRPPASAQILEVWRFSVICDLKFSKCNYQDGNFDVFMAG
jgi:hypothetical protein